MSPTAWFQLAILIGAVAAASGPLGRYMAKVYTPDSQGVPPGDRVFTPIERAIYRLARVDHQREQRWGAYALALLAFSFVSVLAVYLLLRLQGGLPFNPTGRGAMTPWGSFNAAISFVTNTNWQWFSGEQTVSHLTQMLGFAVQNFVSAAVGMTVAVALIRGITRRRGETLGNFWADLVRTCTRILLPIAFVAAIVLISQGVIQNLHGMTTVHPLDAGAQLTQQIPGGPLASQEAIKHLGTNGGGPLNTNSAHPLENPNGWTNLLEIFLQLVIPCALTVTFGRLAGSRRQGRVLLAVMFGFWSISALGTTFAEQAGNPKLDAIGVDQSNSAAQAGGNMEGKDVRLGPAGCALFATSATGTSTGAVNCMHDSLTPLGGLFPTANMLLGEISPGGVGTGMVGMLINALLAVFIAGLMVGRTPELLGKKIQAAEIKLVVLYVMVMPLVVLGFAAATVLTRSAIGGVQTMDAHGLTETLYNFASAANNNGSAFGYVSTGGPWYTITQGLAMLAGRFWLIVPALAIGGSLVRRQQVPATSGTLPTDSGLFGALVAGVIVIVAGLTFFPVLALGPILERLS